jgi:hypothetical protein
MANCKTCGNSFPERRSELGYKTCVNCSTEAKWSGVQVVHHKTGNEIQIVKDPEVAAEFIEKSRRTGFGTMKGVKGSWKRNPTSEITRKREVKPVSVNYNPIIIAKRKVESNYQDKTIGESIMSVLDNEGVKAAKALLEKEFQSLRISPDCRKRLLHLFQFSLQNC